MFFVPAIKDLKVNNNIYLICMSNGSVKGKGKVREKELAESCKYLGIKDFEIYDNPEL